jgi:uncharacterized protein (UPF0128 family)
VAPHGLRALALPIELRQRPINARLELIVAPTPLLLKRAHKRRLNDLVGPIAETGQSTRIATQSGRQSFDRFT